MERKASAVTPERFESGMTFDEYVTYTGTAQNLAREAGWWLGRERQNLSSLLRTWYERNPLTGVQADAVRWLARLAEAGGMELRIFTRDGQTFSREPRANPAASPNADIVNEFLREEDGQTYQSVPVAVFYTKELRYLYHYIEFPAIYHKMRLATAMQARSGGGTREERWESFIRDWGSLQQGPFFPMWAAATVDEILSALHEQIVVGSLA